VREEPAGRIAAFLVPSLKLKNRDEHGQALEESVHRYLLDTFGGYTAAAGNIFGFWKDAAGRESYGEHKRYEVGLKDESKLPELKRFLAKLARDMDEQCLYLQTGDEASFIYGGD
jgi:hypothetical protein